MSARPAPGTGVSRSISFDASALGDTRQRGGSTTKSSFGDTPRRGSVTRASSSDTMRRGTPSLPMSSTGNESKRRSRLIPRPLKTNQLAGLTDSTQDSTPRDESPFHEHFVEQIVATTIPPFQMSAPPKFPFRLDNPRRLESYPEEVSARESMRESLQYDNGHHQMEDFENMIIECDYDDSSCGDITYDESIADEDYYRNRHSHQRGSRSTISGVRSNEKRPSVAPRTTRLHFHDQHTTKHINEPPRSPPQQLVRSSFRSHEDTLGRDSCIDNRQQSYQMQSSFDDTLDAQEMALVELAMELSLRDCGASIISKGTHRSCTSTGSESTNHSAMDTASGNRVWQRDGKKWSKAISSGMDEHNLDAIAEEKDITNVYNIRRDTRGHNSSPGDYSSCSKRVYDDHRLVTPTSFSSSYHAGSAKENFEHIDHETIEDNLHRSIGLNNSGNLSNLSGYTSSPKTRASSRSSSYKTRSSVGNGDIRLPFSPSVQPSTQSEEHTCELAYSLCPESYSEREYNTIAMERSLQDMSHQSLSSNTSFESSRSGISHGNIRSPLRTTQSGTSRPPLFKPSRTKPYNDRLDGAGCHLAMIGAKRPSTRAILNGIDYEEDEEELMAEHLPPSRTVGRKKYISKPLKEVRDGDDVAPSNSSVKLVWKRGPNNKWGKFPE